MSKYTGVLLLLFCIELGSSQYLQAQQRDSETAPHMQAEITALNEDVKTLLREQQEILDKIAELSRRFPGQQQNAAASTLDVRGFKFRGDNAARVAVVEFADFECPYCGLYEREVSPQLLKSYVRTGKVKMFYRDLPLPMHLHAQQASRAALCAGDQGKYWEMHDSLFATQQNLSDPSLHDRAIALSLDSAKFNECLSSEAYADEILKGWVDAQALGVNGTPTFFIGTVSPDGGLLSIKKRIAGTRSYEVFKSLLDEVLAAEGSQSAKAN